jgi:hypothetical protein
LEYDGDCVNFIFDIVNASGEPKNDISSRVLPPDTLRVTIRNYNLMLGNTVLGPVALGEIAGHRFHLLLYVKGARSKGSKLITYRIYIEDSDNA